MLCLVADRLEDAGAAPRQATEHWAELRRRMPRAVRRRSRDVAVASIPGCGVAAGAGAALEEAPSIEGAGPGALLAAEPPRTSKRKRSQEASSIESKSEAEASNWVSARAAGGVEGAAPGTLLDAEGDGKKRKRTLGAARERQRHTLVLLDGLRGARREAEIQAMLQRGEAALSDEDPEAMGLAVLDSVGLLAAPRRLAASQTGEEMTEQAKEELQAASQTRLRALLLRLLGAGGRGGGLDLEDAGTRKLLLVPLERLRHLLRGREPSQLASVGHWAALARAVGLDLEPLRGAVARTKGSAPRRKTNTFAKGERGGKILHDLTRRMMRELGEATAKEVIQAIQSNPTVWAEVSGSLNRLPTKQAKQAAGLESWETSLATNMTRICEKTDRRKGHGIVWRLPDSPAGPSAGRLRGGTGGRSSNSVG